MPIATYHPHARAHRHDSCNDQVIGAILSGWRYDISGIPQDLRGDYEDHLSGCSHCRKRQRLHRTIDALLLAATTLSFAAFLLAALVMRRLEALSHISNVHLHLHGAGMTSLSRMPASVTISLEAVAICGVLVSLLLWGLVAMATPMPSLISSMVRARVSHDLSERTRKQAA
jgi:hypothetical protein